jgi:hypothetical protein
MAHLSLIPQAVHCIAAGLWRRCRWNQRAGSESIHVMTSHSLIGSMGEGAGERGITEHLTRVLA